MKDAQESQEPSLISSGIFKTRNAAFGPLHFRATSCWMLGRASENKTLYHGTSKMEVGIWEKLWQYCCIYRYIVVFRILIKVCSCYSPLVLDLLHQIDEEILSKITHFCSYWFISWLEWEMALNKMHPSKNRWTEVITNRTVIYFKVYTSKTHD